VLVFPLPLFEENLDCLKYLWLGLLFQLREFCHR
jgi:hypothetical protein